MLACGSIYPSLDFYYDGTLSWWERYWRWVVLGIGVVATIIAVALAPFTCGASAGAGAAIATTLFNIAMGTVIGAATTLAIGGITAGISSALKGNGFWNGFAEYYASVNLADVLLTSFAFAAVGVAISNAVGAFQCFKEGTLVATEDGLKPIEEIEVGDKVLAYDETTGEQAYKEVVRLFRNETDEWYHITANGEELVCTGGHPFFVKDKGFIFAKDLSVGDILRLSNGMLVPVSAIAIEKLEQSETTYNFEVADFHTYYVGESEVLVHNTCGEPKIKEYDSKNAALRGAKRDAGISYNQEGKLVKTRIMENGRSKLLYEYTYEVGNDTIKIFEHATHVFNDTGTVIQHHFHVAVNGIKLPTHYVWL